MKNEVMYLEIKIEKLYPDVIVPTKAHSTDACFDIYAHLDSPCVAIYPGQSVKINTGFRTEIPKGYYCDIYARSGLGIKKGLRPSNCVGIIDADYRGEWVVALHNDSGEVQRVSNGDRIAQFAVKEVIPCELIVSDTLSDSERGEGGLGSSGK